MPQAPLRPCPAPGCAALTRGGRCATHARQQEQARGTAHTRGYTITWARYSRDWRRRYPLCGMRADGALHAEHSRCVQAGRTTAAECVDHIVPLARGGAQYDAGNLQSLCTRCNVAKGGR